ncbi:MAG: DUF2834 domain-containing protein [Cyanobacteriota bacterium]|jgi:hypothetical protein
MSNTIETPTPAKAGSRRLLQWLYLTLAVAGAVLPWMANLEFMRQQGAGFDVAHFVQMANANPAAASLSRDLAVAATAVTVWMVVEGRRLAIKGLPLVLLSCVTVAFAFGAPLFLYLRERRLQELEEGGLLKEKTLPLPLP